jgi:hypothetical protein
VKICLICTGKGAAGVNLLCAASPARLSTLSFRKFFFVFRSKQSIHHGPPFRASSLEGGVIHLLSATSFSSIPCLTESLAGIDEVLWGRRRINVYALVTTLPPIWVSRSMKGFIPLVPAWVVNQAHAGMAGLARGVSSTFQQ